MIKLRISSGKEVYLINLPLPDKTITFKGEQGGFVLNVENYLPKRAILNPIPNGGAVMGFMWAIARDVSKEEALQEGNMITLIFKDINGKLYETMYTIGGHTMKIIDIESLQHH